MAYKKTFKFTVVGSGYRYTEEVEAIIALTQGLNRLFSYNSFKFKTFPSSLTNIGLGIMDSLPIKKQLARIAAGGVLTSASLFSDV